MNATARVTILMTPQEKKTLLAQAKRAGSPSVGAYLRRQVLGPDPMLDALIELVQKSTERASAALGQVLTAMQHDAQTAPQRAADVRAKAKAEIRAWTPERLAAFRDTFGLTEGTQP